MIQWVLGLSLVAADKPVTQAEVGKFLTEVNAAQCRKDLTFIKKHTSLDVIYVTRAGGKIGYDKLVSQVLATYRQCDEIKVSSKLLKFLGDHALVQNSTQMVTKDRKGIAHKFSVTDRTVEYYQHEGDSLKYTKIIEQPGVDAIRDGKVIMSSAPPKKPAAQPKKPGTPPAKKPA